MEDASSIHFPERDSKGLAFAKSVQVPSSIFMDQLVATFSQDKDNDGDVRVVPSKSLKKGGYLVLPSPVSRAMLR